jgi:phosphatidylserine/phosphatidylglycerophosphate/cardiolipin synthase-like enzyme
MRASICSSIDSAQSSILLIIYTLADKKIITSLKHAADRGVNVAVIFDPVASPEATFLLGDKISSFGRRGAGLMHQKLLVIDESIVWVGSANMTASSFLQYGNLMGCVRSKVLAERIIEYSKALRTKSQFKQPPLQIRLPSQEFTFFIHPYQANESLKALINKIDGASSRIFVAMYTFTHEELLRVLVSAKKRGVTVKVLFDKDSILHTSIKAYVRCKREGIICSFRKKSGLLHYKAAIIDDCLIFGSANWTKAAFKVNDDCLLFIEPLNNQQKSWVNAWWKTQEMEF